MSKRKILVLVNPEKDNNLVITKEVISFLKQMNCDVFIEDDNYLDENIYNGKTLIDFAIVLGGDGTLLNKLHKYIEYDFPYFGINLGRVGCLTEATKDNYKEKIISILENKYSIEFRNSLGYEILDENGKVLKGIAFNEVSIERGKLFKMLKINIYINNSNKTSFYADGVLVATSTGSSAYNLSCGGPLLLPNAKSFAVTPISPQLKCITSLVVNESDEIEIDISDQVERQLYHETKPIVVVDGKTMIEIDENTRVLLKKNDKVLKIIKVNKESSLFEPTFKVALSSQELFNN